ncbi:MAG: hypothetical protein IJS56_06415 [Bacilli bacterium]|nr:hypothetical protein [Bacilli bacterium]
MFKDIYDLLLEETKKDNLLGYDSLIKILQIFVNKFNLRKDIEIDISNEKDLNVLGCYDILSSKISININNQIKKSETKDLFMLNTYIIQTLIHEITHIRQIKLLTDHKYNELSSNLARLEYILNYLNYYSYSTKYIEKNYGNPNDLKIKNQVIQEYRNYHDLFPMERMAEIYSLKFMKNLISKYDNDSKRKELALVLLDTDLIFNYSYGYVKISNNTLSAPVDLFIEKFNLLEFYELINKLINSLENSKTLDEDKRFKYGLPITIDSYKNLINSGRELIKKKKEILKG